MNVGWDAAHIVMRCRQYRDRLAGHIHAGKNLCCLGNPRKPLVQHLGIEMFEVQENVVGLRPAAAPFADLDCHCAARHVARGEVFGRRRVAFHEALALGIRHVAAFAARALGDQAAGAIDPGRMELDEFHVLQRQPGA
jgi:hypothetical protein